MAAVITYRQVVMRIPVADRAAHGAGNLTGYGYRSIDPRHHGAIFQRVRTDAGLHQRFVILLAIATGAKTILYSKNRAFHCCH